MCGVIADFVAGILQCGVSRVGEKCRRKSVEVGDNKLRVNAELGLFHPSRYFQRKGYLKKCTSGCYAGRGAARIGPPYR